MLYASNFLQHTVWIVFICSAAAVHSVILLWWTMDYHFFLLADVNCESTHCLWDIWKAYGGYLTANNIQKLIAFGNLTLQNNNVDTLYLNNPGKTVNMAYTVTIGSELIANGTPAFPVFIQGGHLWILLKQVVRCVLVMFCWSNVPCSGGAVLPDRLLWI